MASRISNQLNQTMLRVKDPVKSIKFYQKYFNMTMAHQKTFSDFSLYFLVSSDMPTSTTFTPDSDEAGAFINSGKYGVTLELTHNHGTENANDFSYHNGNTDPIGFANIGFLVNDVNKLSSTLKEDGMDVVSSDEATTTTTLCVADPDGYLVEIQQRHTSSDGGNITTTPTFHHSTLRVKDPKKSIEFYKDLWGMTVIAQTDNAADKTTTYYLASLPSDKITSVPTLGSEMSNNYLMSYPGTVLALRHTHGTEDFADFHYDNGNNEPKRGFGHIAFMVEDVYEICDMLEGKGCVFKKKPDDGRMKGLAFVCDPDGYWVEIIRRNSRIPKSL